MPGQPLRVYIDALTRAGEADLGVTGKPQNLQIVGDQLYWLQGTNQELFVLNLTEANAVPRRAFVPHDDAAKERQQGKKDFLPESKEEELLRERQRTRVSGISSYRIRPSDGAIFFTCGMNLFLYHPSSTSPPLRVFDYISEEVKQRCFPSMGSKPLLCIQHLSSWDEGTAAAHSASNRESIVTFVRGSNLYVATIVEQQGDAREAAPLDVRVESVTTFGDELHECGTADYIMQEEFDRFTGHSATERYVLFTYTDTSMLQEVVLIDGSTSSGVEKMRYPRVGDANARTLLVVYERSSGRYRMVPHQAITAAAPWVEYLPRFGFKDKETIYFSLLSRTQERYCVLSCRIDTLPEVDEATLASSLRATGHDTGHKAVVQAAVPFTTEWEQIITWAWVEVHPGPPIVFGQKHDVMLRYASETKTAHCHLYVREGGCSSKDWRPLTQGEWNVRPGSVHVLDDSVVFCANADNRLGNTLYSVSFLAATTGGAAAAQLTRLSPANEHVYSCTVTNGTLCYVSSTASTPPMLYVTSLRDPKTRCCVHSKSLNGTSEMGGTTQFTRDTLIVPSVVTVMSRRGVPLGGRLFASPSAVAGKPSPLAVYVYGGPHVQLVYDSDYQIVCSPLIQLLAMNGISVLVVDGQMSNANGLRDLSICKHNMGRFETSDYVDFVKHMTTSSQLPGDFIADPARIAIFGWSYGGYATLLAMSQAADVFKIGFAGAPVGDWTLYDTGYTERYMGELHSNMAAAAGTDQAISAAYTQSAIKAFVSNFPDDLNRVFIAHGLLDENVHFSHTCAIINAMVDAGKPFSILAYPGERHALRQKKASRRHHDAMLVKTLVEML
ncbi:dipeptidyl-peptidase 8-like serine peptidase [Trypanosoma grayi]|uniref:dipeptidyl-peptidase 8-like serine peptidase n=1 Tax=Trypanosoma grayi TaxID=71804 RepID=UPI0004F45082|nr:dipeptidyl-peptidase 8-like serine peptidase [Trypanosoma grayi]KEG10252.1 dipeptidyl-peptidase 8-like serine peptidase [Trypanosoma grayi]